MAREKVALPVSGVAAESVAVTVTAYVPLAFAAGTPAIAPVIASSVNPAGSEPPVTATGGTGPYQYAVTALPLVGHVVPTVPRRAVAAGPVTLSRGATHIVTPA